MRVTRARATTGGDPLDAGSTSGARRPPNSNSVGWHLRINVLAASQFVGSARRLSLYRRGGIAVEVAGIESGCWIFGPELEIGHGAYINHHVVIDNKAHIAIGAHAAIAMGVMLLTSNHDLNAEPDGSRCGALRLEPIVIGERAWIGARALVHPGVTIGDGCVIASGAVVISDCAPDGVYAGVPARRVRDITAR